MLRRRVPLALVELAVVQAVALVQPVVQVVALGPEQALGQALELELELELGQEQLEPVQRVVPRLPVPRL